MTFINILTYLFYFILVCAAIYIISKVQMRGWLSEIDRFFIKHYKHLKQKENEKDSNKL